MITARLKKKYANRSEAVRDVLDIAGPDSEGLFEYVGKEKIRSPDQDEIAAKELKRLGLEPVQEEA